MAASVARQVRTWSPWIGGGLAGAWLLSMLWWALLEPAQARSQQAELVIPAGTAEAVERGAEPPFIPNSLELSRAGELTVINRDVVAHEVGAWTVPPGGRAVISASEESGQFSCTIHPGGELDFGIDERPSLWTTVIAALVLGLPTGTIFGLAAAVATRLNVESSAPVSS